MQIVVATGVHLQVPGFFRRHTPDPIVELFMRDIEDGIAETGIKAGAIKVATEEEVTAENRLILRAAAITHRATGVPILTHSPSPVPAPPSRTSSSPRGWTSVAS